MSRARDLADGTFSGAFSADSPTLVVDDTNNRVGVGTTSPSEVLEVRKDSASTYGTKLKITNGANYGYGAAIDFDMPLSSGGAVQTAARIGGGYEGVDDGNLAFLTTSGGTLSEAFRVNSDGTICIGKTTTSFGDSGINIFGYGPSANQERINVTRSGGVPLNLNRLSSDGTIAAFYKDSSTVGSIASVSGGMQIYATGVNNTGWTFGNGSAVLPMKNSALSDNFVDLGSSIYRMDDLYATNPTIQTSDANEKQQIAPLTDVEIIAAKAISKLFKTFKWNDKVAEKGDAARTHTGVIAQEVEQAMTDAGLDAGNYAFFIRSTWWEADETYTDDDGVEQTRTNTYDTLEEAPAGAVERTRLGIRYPELLSFIGAATEQRLASIEARLDALEAV